MWQNRGSKRLNNLSKVAQVLSGPGECRIQVWLILSLILRGRSPLLLVVSVLPRILFASGSLSTGLHFAEWLHLPGFSLSLLSISTSGQPLDLCLQVQALQAEAWSHVTECCRSNSRSGHRAGAHERRSRQPSSFKSQLKCHSLNALERSNLPFLWSLLCLCSLYLIQTSVIYLLLYWNYLLIYLSSRFSRLSGLNEELFHSDFLTFLSHLSFGSWLSSQTPSQFINT